MNHIRICTILILHLFASVSLIAGATVSFSLTLASKQGPDSVFATAKGELQHDEKSIQISMFLDAADVRVLKGQSFLKPEKIGPVRFERIKADGNETLRSDNPQAGAVAFYLNLLLPIVERGAGERSSGQSMVLTRGTAPNEWKIEPVAPARVIIHTEKSRFHRRLLIQEGSLIHGMDVSGSGNLDTVMRELEQEGLKEIESKVRNTQEDHFSIMAVTVER